jgi:predicted hydrocarbon binding protein
MPDFRERLAFDASVGEYRDGGIRYMMIRPDALMGILHELPDAMRPTVLEAFARSITRQGGKSAAAYRDAGAASSAALVTTIQETAPQLGWGRWVLTLDENGLDLTVANSPFVAGYGESETPVCHPIIGMLTAVGRMTLGGEVTVRETACAAMQDHDHCRFEVRRVG